ncbi:uncharacterized protein RCC_11339 [Ramularia collo-cygni]|uniref:Uncharacterized protein n=1 Tax=Ramularia collo-cygni TaxID=112498 RepID=A0A2D3VHQ8_9PEZI|nr:uncharacterized protein RCC_11339 [Ramularia collo-cygni]CZT25670.1 uncharacterized protein RCC_11339 [Ramularia collo-cygni]
MSFTTVGGSTVQHADSMALQRLKNRIEDLPPELYAKIKSFVFTDDTFTLEKSTTSPFEPCAHSPRCAAKIHRVVRIDESWRPPRWMQVDLAACDTYADQLFHNGTTFIFPSITVMQKWISSRANCDIMPLLRLKIYCLMPNLTLPPLSRTPTGTDGNNHNSRTRNHHFYVDRIEENFASQLQNLRQLVARHECQDWLNEFPQTFRQLLRPDEVRNRALVGQVRFIKLEKEIFEAACCDI